MAAELQRAPDDLAIARCVEALHEDGWVQAEYEMGTDGALSARPLPKALSATRGWPSQDGQAAAERLIAGLETLAATEPDGDQRLRLQRAREFLIDLGSGTLSELMAKTIGGAL